MKATLTIPSAPAIYSKITEQQVSSLINARVSISTLLYELKILAPDQKADLALFDWKDDYAARINLFLPTLGNNPGGQVTIFNFEDQVQRLLHPKTEVALLTPEVINQWKNRDPQQANELAIKCATVIPLDELAPNDIRSQFEACQNSYLSQHNAPQNIACQVPLP